VVGGTFNDPVLDSLVDRAIAQNLDLALASSRLRQAARRAHDRRRQGCGRGRRLASYDRAGTINGRFAFALSRRARRHVGARHLRRRPPIGRSRNADISSAQEDIRDVLVTLTSEVALNYLDLRGFQRQIVIAQQNLATQLDTAGLVQRRREAGSSGGSMSPTPRRRSPRRDRRFRAGTSERQTIYNIALLLGLSRRARRGTRTEAPIPSRRRRCRSACRPICCAGRPTFAAPKRTCTARRRASASRRRTSFPRFNLTGSLASAGSTIKSLGNASNAGWTIGPGFSWPIFTAGSIRANIAVQNEAQEQSAVSYEQSCSTRCAMWRARWSPTHASSNAALRCAKPSMQSRRA
jgi:outer membrane protein TolC